jgi:hypothetical protein
MLYDGTFHEDKEDHVWMNAEPFAEYKKDDAVEFYAEIYRYLKTGHGKQIDFGIINPYNIQQIDLYQLPSDEFLLNQAINALVCEVCMFNNHCNGIFCLANDEWKNGMKEMLLAVSGELPEDINDINTTEQIAKNKDIAS